MVFAGDVGGKVWADEIAGPQLELESVVAAALVAVGSSCPVSKDERSWKKGVDFCHIISILTCAILACITVFLFHNMLTRVKILRAISI